MRYQGIYGLGRGRFREVPGGSGGKALAQDSKGSTEAKAPDKVLKHPAAVGNTA